jgi:hypothetical protein
MKNSLVEGGKQRGGRGRMEEGRRRKRRRRRSYEINDIL